MNIGQFTAYSRKAQYLHDAMVLHHEECEQTEEGCGGEENCLRCQNLAERSNSLLAETPQWLLKILKVFMWIRHPIIMYRADGDISKIK